MRAAAIGVLLLPACRTAGGARYVHPNVDLAALRTVAVLPFENLTQDRAAGDKVQKVFITELLSLEAFQVVEPGTVVKALRADRIESVAALGPAEIKHLGEALKADGLFMGSVVDFAETRSGTAPAPEVTIELRLVETQSGVTVWSSNRTRSGASASARLFGIGGESLTQAAREVIREQLGTLVN
ncbi:MAG TPA: CsgG/HfaB family protein [Vicinamibacteria bacterium]